MAGPRGAGANAARGGAVAGTSESATPLTSACNCARRAWASAAARCAGAGQSCVRVAGR